MIGMPNIEPLLPVTWQYVPLKYVVRYNLASLPEYTYPEYEFDYIDIGSVSYNKGIEQYQHLTFKDAPSRARRIVYKNDVIISTVRTYLKATAQIPDNVNPIIVSTGFITLTAKEEILTPLYLKYAIQFDVFISDIESRSTGISYPAINSTEAVMTKIVLPPLDVQERIAAFLDSQCTEIDALSADIQSEIDTLEEYKRSVITEAVTKGLNPDAKMKDSGVQWIGQMPKHWDCIRGKYVLHYLNKPVRSDDGVITCFRDGEVTLRSNRREDGFTMADKEIGYQGIDVGDLVVHGMDGFAGAIGISDSRGKASPVLNVLDTDMDKRYVMFYLRSMAYSNVFVALATGIRVRSCDLRWNKLAELFYPVPPIEEQKQIADYIEKQLQKTNSLISVKKEQLATLDEYKKSLIYEYVTGKKEVPKI